MLNLVCVGACYLDTILSVPHFPEEDSKLRATSLSVRRGGNCPNSLEVLQQLLKAQEGEGHKVVRPYLISCLPSAEGPASARVRDSFGPDSPVDFTRCIYREQHDQPASSYIIRSEAAGTRTLVNYNDLPEMTVHEFQAAIDGLDRQNDMWVHFEGRIPETTLSCIQYLRHAVPKARVSVEVEKPGREGLQELAAEADVVVYSKSWAESNGYQSAHECLMAQSEVACRASLLLCTWGSEGAASLSLPSKKCVSCPALRPGQTVRVVEYVSTTKHAHDPSSRTPHKPSLQVS
ncbi:pfkB family kinase [Apiospora sp. TS-2023a]